MNSFSRFDSVRKQSTFTEEQLNAEFGSLYESPVLFLKGSLIRALASLHPRSTYLNHKNLAHVSNAIVYVSSLTRSSHHAIRKTLGWSENTVQSKRDSCKLSARTTVAFAIRRSLILAICMQSTVSTDKL